MSEPTDLVERLRGQASRTAFIPRGQILLEAADTIESLRAKLADMTDDYLRRHNDAVDEFEKRVAAESTISAQAAVIETLREAIKRFVYSGRPSNWDRHQVIQQSNATASYVAGEIIEGEPDNIHDAYTALERALSTLPSSSIERMAKEKKVVEAAGEVHRTRALYMSQGSGPQRDHHLAHVQAVEKLCTEFDALAQQDGKK